MNYKNNILSFIVLVVVFLSACTSDHYDLNEGTASGDNLYQTIKANSDLSIFAECLEKTGYDKILASSKVFTVWAPVNSACDSLSKWLLSNDTASIRKTVANHICFVKYPYLLTSDSIRVKTLGGKYHQLVSASNTIEEAALQAPFDRYAGNGILHVIDKTLLPKLNIWDYLKTSTYCTSLYTFLKTYDGTYFDVSASTKTGSDPNTGAPVYDSVFVATNQYMLDNGRLNNEDSVYTYIVLTDAAFTNEYNKFYPYCINYSSAATDSTTKHLVYKDFIIRGKIKLANLKDQDTLISTTGVKIPFNKSLVKNSYEASNGIVYVLDGCSIRPKDKFRPIIIEAETATNRYYIYKATFASGKMTSWYSNSVSTSLLYTRARSAASSGYDLVYKGNTNTASGLVFDNIHLYSNIKYKFYWVAVNDLGVNVSMYPLYLRHTAFKDTYSQTVLDDYQSGSATIAMDGSYSLYHKEVYLGSKLITNIFYPSLFVVLSGTSSAVATTPITLDYIKIVADIQ